MDRCAVCTTEKQHSGENCVPIPIVQFWLGTTSNYRVSRLIARLTGRLRRITGASVSHG